MLKNYKIIKQIGSIISSAADEICFNVLGEFSDLNGREEEITLILRREINQQLLDSIKKKLGGQNIGGCKFTVATFKKKQESKIGADLAGIIEFNFNGRTVSKAFLAQSKVAKSYQYDRNLPTIKCANKDILNQAVNMLQISSDSFFFLYSKDGIYCVPALQVHLAGLNVIDTATQPFHKFGAFYEEFFKCFIGDHLISPNKFGAVNLEDYAEKIKANAILKITVELD
jgi:hypothetical protein